MKLNTKGFSLAELLIAVTIIAVLSGIGLVFFSDAQKAARDAKRKRDLRSIQVALESYYSKNGRYPCSTNDFTGSDNDWDTSFEYATSNWWIVDKADSQGQCVSGSTGTNSSLPFTSSYISELPRDPKNLDKWPWDDGEAYSYAYLSPEDLSDVSGCPKGQGQYYLLVARLERNDGEVQKPEEVNFCDGYPVVGYHELGGQDVVLMGTGTEVPDFNKLLILTSQN